jgi:hypothetical protein
VRPGEDDTHVIADSGRALAGYCLGPPGIGTRIVKSKRHVVAVGDLDATETAGPMTSSERYRA